MLDVIFQREFMRKILMLGLSFFVFSCASPIAQGPKFSMHEKIGLNESLFYIYRPSSDDGGAVCLTLLIDESERGCLSGAGYLKFKLKPGKYNMVLMPNAPLSYRLLESEVILEEGKVHYVEYNTTTDPVPQNALDSRYFSFGVLSGHHIVVERPESEALNVLVTLAESIEI